MKPDLLIMENNKQPFFMFVKVCDASATVPAIGNNVADTLIVENILENALRRLVLSIHL